MRNILRELIIRYLAHTYVKKFRANPRDPDLLEVALKTGQLRKYQTLLKDKQS